MDTRLLMSAMALVALAAGCTTGPQVHTALLTGGAETPAVATQAQGGADFRPDAGHRIIRYNVRAGLLRAVEGVELHLGQPGQGGPVVASLNLVPSYHGAFTDVASESRPIDQLANGQITCQDLRGPMAGRTVDDLVCQIAAGNTYVNIRTARYPQGEIRGQVGGQICLPHRVEAPTCPTGCPTAEAAPSATQPGPPAGQ